MRLTKRGHTVAGIAGALAFVALMGVAGAIETQDMPTCSDHEASQNWEAAWSNGCPFQDNNGNYLYTWEPN
jgi:hypothetical protein